MWTGNNAPIFLLVVVNLVLVAYMAWHEHELTVSRTETAQLLSKCAMVDDISKMLEALQKGRNTQ
jgi:hypothetical protein